MVSKAREDLPEPLGPVTTFSFPSGRSRSKPFRLFWRTPRIWMTASVRVFSAEGLRSDIGWGRMITIRPWCSNGRYWRVEILGIFPGCVLKLGRARGSREPGWQGARSEGYPQRYLSDAQRSPAWLPASALRVAIPGHHGGVTALGQY